MEKIDIFVEVYGLESPFFSCFCVMLQYIESENASAQSKTENR